MRLHPTVSIALATFNGERFLRQQLQTLSMQTVLPFELVVCDDQSSDSTVDIVSEFAKTAPFPVRMHVNPIRLHVGSNFLRAAELCTGDFIAFCDQDDLWNADRLEKSLAALTRPNVVFCAHDAVMIDEAENVIGYHVHAVAAEITAGSELAPWTVFYGFTCTFPRALLQIAPASQRPFELNDPKRKMAHDRWISLLATLAGSIVNLKEPLAKYRQHDANASRGMRSRRDWRSAAAELRINFALDLRKHYLVASAMRQFADRALIEDAVFGPGAAINCERARKAWLRREKSYRARLDIAEADSRLQRLALLARAFLRGIYRDAASGKIDSKQMLRDVFRAVYAKRGQKTLAARALIGAGSVG